MALQVWLPLNGNFNNNGHLDTSITITNTGTVDNSGKIGKCYSYPTTGYTLLSGNILAGLKEFSIACWVYITSSSYTIFTSEDTSGYWQFVFGQNYIRVRDTSVGVTGSRLDKSITSLPLNKWIHVTIVYDNGIVHMYQNGLLTNNLTFHTGTSMNPHNRLYIGGDALNGSSYQGKCKVNDFRIYDHCLSAKEINELSKGLVLHYKLDENYQVMNNVFSYPTFNTSASNGGWPHWGPSGSEATWSQNTDKEFIWNKSNQYSHKMTLTGGQRYMIHQSPAFDGGYRSVQAIIKFQDGSDPTGKVGLGGNAITNYGKFSITPLRDGFYLIKREGLYQTGTDDLIALNTYAMDLPLYISEFYLEDNKTVCSDILWPANIVTDCSGYGHHGIIMTDVSINTDSPRYKTCVSNAENYPLRTTFDFPESNGLTIACWIYLTAWGAQGSGLWSTSTISTTNPYDYTATTCNHCDTYFYCRGTNGTTYTVACGTGVVQVNTWKYVVLTHDGENLKTYVNGELKYTTACPTTLVGFKSLFLGYSNAGSLSRQCKGKWSDLRIYATALSDNDILDLYHTSAFIDNTGNLLAYNFEETCSNIAFKTNLGIIDKQYADGLSSFQQRNCVCTLTNEGYRIYRTPNITYDGTSATRTMYGGFLVTNTNNRFGLQTGHRYVVQFEVKGQTSNSVAHFGFSFNFGNNFANSGLMPEPSNVYTNNPVKANFNSQDWVTITHELTINDDIWKVCERSASSFVSGNTYLSYRHFAFAFDYKNTGELGTDLYIRNFRIYDITNFSDPQILKNGSVKMSEFMEEEYTARIFRDGVMKPNNMIEY